MNGQIIIIAHKECPNCHGMGAEFIQDVYEKDNTIHWFYQFCRCVEIRILLAPKEEPNNGQVDTVHPSQPKG